MKWVIIFSVFFFSTAYAEQCSQQDFDKADMAMDSLTSWKVVDVYFSRYKDCDVGYVHEGTSDMIIHLLVNKWEKLNELSILIRSKSTL